MPKKKLQSPALRYAYDRYIKGTPEREASFEEELTNAEIARKLYDLRMKAGLSQRELARLVGTTASVICRLEDADHEGHSLGMVRRIAEALDKKVEIRSCLGSDIRAPTSTGAASSGEPPGGAPDDGYCNLANLPTNQISKHKRLTCR